MFTEMVRIIRDMHFDSRTAFALIKLYWLTGCKTSGYLLTQLLTSGFIFFLLSWCFNL